MRADALDRNNDLDDGMAAAAGMLGRKRFMGETPYLQRYAK